MSGLEVIGGISAVVAIIDSCVKVYGSGQKDLRLPEALNVVARQLPILSDTLLTCKHHLESRKSSIPPDVCNALEKTLASCKEKAGRLQTIFETVITQEGDGWKTRYRKILNRFGKGNAVEELMKVITEDVQHVVHNDAVRSAQPEQTQQLNSILEELQSLKPSVVDEDGSFIRTQNNNTGHGQQFNIENMSGNVNWVVQPREYFSFLKSIGISLDQAPYREDPGCSASHANVHLLVPRVRNPLFTGRNDVLGELKCTIINAIKNPSDDLEFRIVISGMGGQGKSEICLQLAHHLKQMFWGVFWIDLSSTFSAESSLLNLARILSLPAQTWTEAILAITNLKHRWLLVLDNADDPHVNYQPYIPSGPLGVVILTTRNVECHIYATVKPIELEGLCSKEAQELLQKAAHIPQKKAKSVEADTRTVATLLQRHPLALIQAGNYVSGGYCEMAPYHLVLKHKRHQLLTFYPKQAQSRHCNIYATFEASVDIIKTSTTETARDALQLLPSLAICSSNQMPLSLFEAGWKGAKTESPGMNGLAEDKNIVLLTPWHVTQLLPLMNVDSDAWNSFRLVRAINLLKNCALVSTDDAYGYVSVSMHPLIHAWARDRMVMQDQNWLGMACLFAFSRHDVAYWRKYERQLQPHLEALTAWELDKMFLGQPSTLVARVLVNCGWLLCQIRSYTKLFKLMETIFRLLKLQWAEVDENWIGLYDLAARSLIGYGRGKKAIPILEQLVEIRERPIAPGGQSLLRTEHTLAEVYALNGEAEKAVALLKKVLKSPPDDSPDRLMLQYGLAGAYRKNGQIEEAVALLEKIVEIQEQSWPENHPNRLGSQHALMEAYMANGQIQEAASLMTKLVKIHDQSLVDDHSHQLVSQFRLAGVYRASGQVKESVSLLEELLKIQDEWSGENHSNRQTLQYALAEAYQANGQAKDAIILLEKVQEQLLAEDHPDRLASQYALAHAYLVDGQGKRALALLRELVKVYEHSLEEDHPYRLGSQYILARACHASGEVKEAISLLQDVLKIQDQSQAEHHPYQLEIQYALATAFWADGELKQTIDLLEKISGISKQSLSAEHPYQVTIHYSLAEAYQANGQTMESLAILMKLTNEVTTQLSTKTKILDQLLTEDRSNQLTLQYAHAAKRQLLGQLKKTISLLEKIMRSLEQSPPESHPMKTWLQKEVVEVRRFFDQADATCVTNVPRFVCYPPTQIVQLDNRS